MSIISTTSMLEFQELIRKVRESRYLKDWERQISKFSRLLQKEGNIIWSSTPNLPQLHNSTDPASTPSQLGRNAGRAGTHSQASSVSPTSQEGMQALQALIPRQGVLVSQPDRGAGSTGTHSQAGSPPTRKECRQCRHSFPTGSATP